MRVGRSEAESPENDLGLGLEPVAAQGLEAMLHLTIPLRQLRARVLGGHQGSQALELRLESPDLVES